MKFDRFKISEGSRSAGLRAGVPSPKKIPGTAEEGDILRRPTGDFVRIIHAPPRRLADIEPALPLYHHNGTLQRNSA
jgi:hypothetical protein